MTKTKLGTKSVYNILVVPVNHNRESSTTMDDITYRKVVIYY